MFKKLKHLRRTSSLQHPAPNIPQENTMNIKPGILENRNIVYKVIRITINKEHQKPEVSRTEVCKNRDIGHDPNLDFPSFAYSVRVGTRLGGVYYFFSFFVESLGFLSLFLFSFGLGFLDDPAFGSSSPVPVALELAAFTFSPTASRTAS